MGFLKRTHLVSNYVSNVHFVENIAVYWYYVPYTEMMPVIQYMRQNTLLYIVRKRVVASQVEDYAFACSLDEMTLWPHVLKYALLSWF